MEPTTVELLILLGPILNLTAAQQVKIKFAKSIYIFLYSNQYETVSEFIRLYFNAVMLLSFIFHYGL